MEVLIRLTEHGTAEVEVIHGLAKCRYDVTLADLASAIAEAAGKGDTDVSPALPRNTVGLKKFAGFQNYAVAVLVEKGIYSFNYCGQVMNVGYPRLVFAFKVAGQNVADSFVAAVKDFAIRDDTPLFRYPYSNVHDNTSICWGTTQLPRIGAPWQLHSLPNLFFAAENNNDLYPGRIPLRELLESQKDREFNEELLEPLGLTFAGWFQKI